MRIYSSASPMLAVRAFVVLQKLVAV